MDEQFAGALIVRGDLLYAFDDPGTAAVAPCAGCGRDPPCSHRANARADRHAHPGTYAFRPGSRRTRWYRSRMPASPPCGEAAAPITASRPASASCNSAIRSLLEETFDGLVDLNVELFQALVAAEFQDGHDSARRLFLPFQFRFVRIRIRRSLIGDATLSGQNAELRPDNAFFARACYEL
ncbi:hypothetical protein [Xanthomonas theicola]|uniref:hypothetical protein n=1 Tax=Xanthomonas theicola TaxID=56464 RepID=UPI0036D84A58